MTNPRLINIEKEFKEQVWVEAGINFSKMQTVIDKIKSFF